MTEAQILGYTKRRVLLRHKVSKGNCQRCGLPSKERYRLATKCLCRKCVEQAFERKIMTDRESVAFHSGRERSCVSRT